jgi:hypothetical protein
MGHRHVFQAEDPPGYGKFGGWWMSVVDYTPAGPVGVGVVIVPGFVDDPQGAAVELNRLLPGEGGEVMAVRYPAVCLARVCEADRNRLLVTDDLRRMGENTLSLDELDDHRYDVPGLLDHLGYDRPDLLGGQP